MKISERVEIKLMQRSGWWVALCEELDISGLGDTEIEALQSLEKSLISTLKGRFKTAITSSEEIAPDEFGVKRFPLNPRIAA